MKNNAICILLLGFALGPLPLKAQVATKDLPAIDILSRAVTAVGAPAGLLKTAHASGSYTRFLPNGKAIAYDLKMIAAGPDKVRWETTGPDDKVITVIEGNAGWVQVRGKKKALSLSDMAGRGFEQFPVLALASWSDAPDIELKYVGRAGEVGSQLDQVRLSKSFALIRDANTKQALQQVTRVEWFFDANSALPVWARCYENASMFGDRLPVDLVFSDFRDLGGAFIPTTVTTYLSGQKVGVLHFDSVKLNVAVSPSDFKE